MWSPKTDNYNLGWNMNIRAAKHDREIGIHLTGESKFPF